MAQSTTIYLTHEQPTNDWQADNLVQLSGNDIYVYIKADDPWALRKIQKAGRKIEALGVKKAVLAGKWTEHQQWSFALGFTCVGKLTDVQFAGDNELVNHLTEKLAIYAWSRDLTNQTPAELYPSKLAEESIRYLTSLAPNAISSTVIEGEALLEHGWVGIYNVGKGSEHPPCLVEIDYNPSQDANAKVDACLVGKGITFDSGGYSLKASAGMLDMKCDMGGAAVVAGAFGLAIKQGLTKRVKLFLCCAENMVSSFAYRLGDVIEYKNGVTVEVANTDAEGRLVLADGLMAASETGAELIIDAATLTGAAVMATGADYTALFGLDQALMSRVKTAAEEVNEPVWQLPLEEWHKDKCTSAFATTANSRPQKGGGAGGASNAAGFLSRFVAPTGWVHMDIAAAYNANANSYWAAGGTGLSIATIAQLLR
ncbi:aminopeptidase PepB [Thalassotalea atypica]|uniref:aminopeptidase PepB n=1 Tax=Thalassotalea atypica TaxID=2054316 RepID=UPI002573FF3A|nr:aminopeptidase PepB [Thalassotalea atypica]